MLKVGRVIHTRAEEHDGRLCCRFRRDVLQDIKQGCGIVIVGEHIVVVKQRRKYSLDDLPVLQHVADARRRAGIVFKHQILAVGRPDQVGAADVDVDPPRHVDADKFPPEEASLQHEPRRHHAVAENVLLVVDVPEKQV